MSTEAARDAEDFYVAAMPRLIGTLTILTGSRQDAEDVAQAAMVRLLERWAKISRYESPEAWVRLVAVRIAISNHRKRHRLSLRSFEVETFDAVAERTTHQTDSRLDLERAIGALTHEQREVVVLHYLCDCSIEATAEVLRISQSAVKSRLSRARSELLRADPN